ncbi:glucosaminidase domain-containing protein [Clostridium sp. CF012]|uniref:glucosaminidase domain-containing protein n=1 Tax=Clostridium sp. CF012 TaxID=2843319 RepID=UPI001C0E22BC|nr:glucosaminidase domain-containing protein [Clostridium sp. CF012]MBU3144930.1 peptidoglycan-binding protein [Clostridium sp. CF012]
MDKEKIIKQILPGALVTFEKYGLFPSVTMAQVILETGWLKVVKGNNIFGIKWTKGCGFEVQEILTNEWINGVITSVMAKFRKYNSIEESILDYGKFLTTIRYRGVLNSDDYQEACVNLYKCGYSTDVKYASKLINLIEENKLYIYDPKGKGSAKVPTKEEIMIIQRNFNILKIKDSNNKTLVVDGIYGPATISAIKSFQKILGLVQDGVLNENIVASLNEVMNKSLCSIKSNTNKATIKYIQWRLNISVDGIFGIETLSKIKEFQARNGLEADGIVGKNTWSVFLK